MTLPESTLTDVLTPAPAAGPVQPLAGDLARPGYQLDDAVWADTGTVFLTGTQALVRLLRMQRSLDAAAGLATQGFVSGYRGSPLGGVDQALWKAGERLVQAGVRFVPAINEELGATQVLGTQRVESDPERTCDGVFALWYGKGPGVDRAGDALKHGNAFGSSPHGGVLVVAGDDHGCVSSSMPHQSDGLFQAFHMPVLQPDSVAELLAFGLYGWALSRYSGNWVALAALSEVVESASTVDLDALADQVGRWQGADAVRAATGHQPPAEGLHYRWPDLPSLAIESRVHAKLQAVAAFARVNAIDRHVIVSPQATLGIVTCGKAHRDVLEVLRRLAITPEMLAQAGVRLYKVGLAWPVEPTRLRAFAQGLREILVVEEKAPMVETQLRDLLYDAPANARPAVLGKRGLDGAPLLSALGELRPSRLIEAVADWLVRHFPQRFADRLALVRDFTAPAVLSNAADAVRRLPYFCAGCPHNTSTQVPEGSTARAGIGCHFMANWMDRDTAGLIQMGGEGVDWVSHALFTRVPHVFQNLGDGTYYHSGYLAIRQAVASGANITYKILFNDAVAMTGGQPVDGITSVDAIARQVDSEGVQQVVVVSDHIGAYANQRARFPAATRFHDRSELDAVQRRLREVPGVTVLIYEQTCAAEKRRRRKKGQLVDPDRRLFIHEAVCEGCGDCTVQSNCVAVLPHDQAPSARLFGRKRRIDASACNKDETCAQGFCPSFVGVSGGRLRRRAGALAHANGLAHFERCVAAMPLPPAPAWSAPWDLLVTGVGGTGVVTVGAVVAMAAHLQGHSASVLDFMGFAQKGGAVLSFVRLADRPERLNQVRIDTQQADALLACDAVVGASPEALQAVRHGRTRVLVNVHETPVAGALRDPDSRLQTPLLLDKLRHAAGDTRFETFDAHALAEAFLGDTVAANILALGYAWQRGLVPVSLPALLRALELNGVAVAANRLAFSIGRLAAGDPAACVALREAPAREDSPTTETLAAFLAQAQAHLADWQDGHWAARYAQRVMAVQTREAALGGDGSLSLAVARSLLRLMSPKDEYEVARLFTNGSLQQALAAQFEGDIQLDFQFAPAFLTRRPDGRPPAKRRFGPWVLPLLRLLALGRHLRGRWFDPLRHSEEAQLSRQLLSAYEARLDELLPALPAAQLPLATQIAALPQTVRGYGHVKAANAARTRQREAELLHRLDPQRYPAPPRGPVAGQFKGIAVTAGR